MKKKLLSLVLVATMALGLTACGGAAPADPAAPAAAAAQSLFQCLPHHSCF